jgi:hypothetical protein
MNVSATADIMSVSPPRSFIIVYLGKHNALNIFVLMNPSAWKNSIKYGHGILIQV